MTDTMWIKSHVELLLQREWGLTRVPPDPDGDFAFRRGTAMCWVSVLDCEPPMVRVFAHAAFGLRPSLKLYKELNDIQGHSLTARVQLVNDLVLVSQTLSPIGLTQPALAQAMDAVGSVADECGLMLAIAYGGNVPFACDDEDEDEDVSEETRE